MERWLKCFGLLAVCVWLSACTATVVPNAGPSPYCWNHPYWCHNHPWRPHPGPGPWHPYHPGPWHPHHWHPHRW